MVNSTFSSSSHARQQDVKLSACKVILSYLFPAALRRITSSLFIIGAIVIAGAATPAQAKYASMVVDADTGEVLHAVNVDQRNFPASLTKIMTLYLLFDELDSGHLHMTDRMPISAHAAAQAPSKLGLEPGDSLKVEDAILGIVTKSANDAAVTVAEFIGGSESGFAEKMTRKARELGMRQTEFRNASGLPRPPNVSTARDMMTLARAMIHNHAKYYHYFSTREFVYNGQVMRNHNHLMEHYTGADGIKTGYIAASGFNLVESAKRDGRRLIGVVFGGQSAAARDRHMAHLLDAAFARPAGASGVEMAQLPDQAEESATTASGAAQQINADDTGADTRAVMRAMASAKAAPAARKIAKARPPKAADDSDDAAGDADEDNWAIQVGAYSQSAKARSAAEAAFRKLGKLVADGEVSVARSKGRHHIYRARVIGLPENTAHKACSRLNKSHMACKVINLGVNVATK